MPKIVNKRANENHSHIKKLTDAYNRSKLAIFIGAGLSIPLGIPNWKNLIDRLVEDHIAYDQTVVRNRISNLLKDKDYWAAIEEIKHNTQETESSIQLFIAKTLSDFEHFYDINLVDNNYIDMSKEYFDVFITTNYDNALDNALREGNIQGITPQSYNGAYNLLLDRRKKNIIYMHGHISNPETIVITEKKYDEIYNSDSNWRNILLNLFSEYTLLFIGVSFDDKFMLKFLKENSQLNKNENYAIQFNKSEKRCFELKKESNISTILYSCSEDQYIYKIRETIDKITVNAAFVVVFLSSQNLRSDIERYINGELKGCLSIPTHVSIFGVLSRYILLIKENTIIMDTLFSSINKFINNVKNKGQIISIMSYESPFGKVLEHNQVTEDYLYILRLLQNKIAKNSSGIIINKMQMVTFSKEDISEILTEKRLELESRKGKQKIELSLLCTAGIQITDAVDIGVEVHVTGACFFENKILLQKRLKSDVIASGLWATPGGRLKKLERFEEALIRKFNNDCSVELRNIRIVDSYEVKEAKIPGLLYYCNIRGGMPTASTGIAQETRFFTLEEVEKLHADGCLANDTNLLNKCFDMNNKYRKKTIKLRLIMLRECNYDCKLCHHESIDNDVVTNIACIQENIKRLSEEFDISALTITGGEPLLESNIERVFGILDYIKNEKICLSNKISIITNGSKLTVQNIKRFSEYDVKFKISLYGYDDKSFETYTGRKKENYIIHFFNILKLLDNHDLEYSINVVYNSIIKRGLNELLSNEDFIKLSKKIKIIDMVSPENKEQDFDLLYESTDCLYNKDKFMTEVNDNYHYCNTVDVAINKTKLYVYFYPCKIDKNCSECFEKFSLSMKPDGSIIVCEKSVEREDFKQLMRNMNIDTEFVDYKQKYNL